MSRDFWEKVLAEDSPEGYAAGGPPENPAWLARSKVLPDERRKLEAEYTAAYDEWYAGDDARDELLDRYMEIQDRLLPHPHPDGCGTGPVWPDCEEWCGHPGCPDHPPEPELARVAGLIP